MKRALLMKVDRAVGLMLHATMLATFAGLLLLVAFIVATRIFALASAGWTDELVEFLFAWLIFSGAASLWRENGHFAVTLIADVVKSGRLRTIIAVTSEILGLAFLVVFTYQSCVLIAGTGSEASPVFSLPKTYWYICMPIAGVIMIVYSIARLIERAILHVALRNPTMAELRKYEV